MTAAYDLAARYLDAERVYACAILHVSKADVLAAVDSQDIADPVARGIHAVARQLLAEGQTADPVTIALAAATSKLPGRWQEHVPNVLTHPGAVPANWPSYVAAIREGATRRRAVAVAERIMQVAETSTMGNLAAALAEAGQVIR